MNLLWVFVYFLEIVKCILIGNTFFYIKFKKKKVIVLLFLLYVVITSFNYKFSEYFSLLTVIFVFITLLFIIDVNKIKKITVLIKVLFIVFCMDGISKIILKLFLSNILSENVYYFILNNMITIAVFLYIRLIKKKYEAKYEKFLKVIAYICAITTGISIFLVITDIEKKIEMTGKNEYIVSYILIIVYYASIMMIILFLLYMNDTNSKIKKYLEIERLLNDTQKNYYETMLKKEEDTRRYRHDMINHLIYLQNLLERNQEKEAQEYIQNLQDGMKYIQKKCYYVGNSVIDAMLNQYIQELDEEVSVSISGNYMREADINQIELCSIISNLVKNSVEAINRQLQEGKYLKVNISSGNENMKIEIINSIDKGEQNNKGNNQILPETVKKDKKNHGFGMKNILETVEKNNGMFQWETGEGYFKVIVILPVKKTENEKKIQRS